MLPVKNKFSKEDFKSLKSFKTKRINSELGYFVVFIKDLDKNKKTTKNTIVVSKKVAKSSVQRNKIKRLFYNLMLELRPEISFIFFANKILTKSDKEKLQQIIKNICLPQ